MQKILFVCLGNICRSPMAEFIMKKMVKDAGLQDEFEISSAATSDEVIGYDIYPPAKECLRKHGIPFDKRGARQVTQNDYDYYDHIFTMDRDNQRCMKMMFGDNAGKIRPLMTLSPEKTSRFLTLGTQAISKAPTAISVRHSVSFLRIIRDDMRRLSLKWF